MGAVDAGDRDRSVLEDKLHSSAFGGRRYLSDDGGRETIDRDIAHIFGIQASFEAVSPSSVDLATE